MKIVKAVLITEEGDIIELKNEKKSFSFFKFIDLFLRKQIYFIIFSLIFSFIVSSIFFQYKMNEILKIGYFAYNNRVYKLFEVSEGEK